MNTASLAHRGVPAARLGVDKDSSLLHPGSNSRHTATLAKTWVQAALIFACILLISLFYQVDYRATRPPPAAVEVTSAPVTPVNPHGPVLVSYSYFEKDEIQRANMEFFLSVGMGIASTFKAPVDTDFVVVISGDLCSPCKVLLPAVKDDKLAAEMPQLTAAWSTEGLALLQRVQNEGMDFAAHNVTIEWLRLAGTYSKYRYFVFLNSSVRGPFYASYMPQDWQWTRAYTDRLTGNVKVVSSSLTCLPPLDDGGFGPKVESWAFALDPEGLDLLANAGVFYLRTCKLCADGVVVMGEYGLSNVLLNHGYNIATLMSKYSISTDWRNEKHWHCNNNVHPSRHGTYDGISMHPFETVFIKASWHVGEPHLSHYTNWFLGHAEGNANTGGSFYEPMYRYAISPEAQNPNNAEACFRVLG
ncbi:hypothetical protein WJX72_010022 [[Myrmecia] bisecta]|uniref:Uncharacterized protein n=1 Tax=[Myrmecia] bisecta TaxID=41462 RepID=A0AAW1Q7N2_9CHLO